MFKTRPIRVLLLAGFLALWAGAARAKEVTVTLKSGETVCGELIKETSASITIRLANESMRTLSRDEIVGAIQERLTLEEQYRVWRAAVAETDAKGRLEVARLLYANTNPDEQTRAWALALIELDAVLALNPGLQEADLMRRDVQLKLKAAGEMPTPGAGLTLGVGSDGNPIELTEEQIARMKVFEVDLNVDPPPNVVVPPKVAEAFLRDYTRAPMDPAMEPYKGAEGARAFKRLKGDEQLGLILQVRAREYYGRVTVRDEPASLRTWRTNIHPQYVTRHCGTCHRQEDVAGMDLLWRGDPAKEKLAYTNLILLAHLEVDGQPLISRGNPEESLLLQYGLKREEAIYPHPDVKGFKPKFRDSNDLQFRLIADWIGGRNGGLGYDPREMLEDWQPEGEETAATP